MNISEALRYGTERLQAASIESPEREAASLLKYILRCDAAFLYAHSDQRLDAVQSILFKAVVKRRAGHEPLQYITGVQEFFGLEFDVTRDVLIPRPETEVLVEAAIDKLKYLPAPRFCEIGVGSGCNSISILKKLANVSAIGVDISDAALKIAIKNAEKHSVNERLDLHISNLFDKVDEYVFDAIVSNPPYIPTNDIDALQEEVRSFEPRAALEGGPDGLDIVKRIIEDAPKHLKTGGLLLIEIGWDQSERVAAMLDNEIWKDVEFLPDLQGIPRILRANIR
jgi:release factor glutamine methyltransferase